MPCEESKQLFAKASVALPHPRPDIFRTAPPDGARVFRVDSLDQRLEPAQYRLVVHVRHTLLTGAPEQATRGQAADDLKALDIKTIQVRRHLPCVTRRPHRRVRHAWAAAPPTSENVRSAWMVYIPACAEVALHQSSA